MDLTFLLMLAAFTLFAALAHGVTGFGFSLVLIGLLAAATGEVKESSFYSNMLCLVVQVTIILQMKAKFPWRHVWPFLAGAAVAVPAGVWLLATFGEQRWLNRVLGGVITGIALWMLIAPRRPHVHGRPQRGLGLLAGIASGLVGGMFNTGGPPAVMYVYSRPIALNTAKLAIQFIFTGMSTYRLVVSSVGGLIPLRIAWMSAAVAPLVVIGGLVGLKVANRIHPEIIRRLVFALLILIGLKLLIWP